MDFLRNKHSKEKVEQKHGSHKGSVKTQHVVLEVCSVGKAQKHSFKASQGIVINAITVDKLSSFLGVERWRRRRASVSLTRRSRRCELGNVSKPRAGGTPESETQQLRINQQLVGPPAIHASFHPRLLLPRVLTPTAAVFLRLASSFHSHRLCLAALCQ